MPKETLNKDKKKMNISSRKVYFGASGTGKTKKLKSDHATFFDKKEKKHILIDVNVWDLFGNRNPKDFSKTSENGEQVRIPSIYNAETGGKSYNVSQNKDGRITYTYIKKTIWKYCLGAVEKKNKVLSEVKDLRKNNNIKTFKKNIWADSDAWSFLSFIIILFIVLQIIATAIFFALYKQVDPNLLAKIIFPIFAIFSSAFATISFVFRKKMQKKMNSLKNENYIWLDSLYNKGYKEFFIKTKGRKRKVLIHVHEIDKLFWWLVTNNVDTEEAIGIINIIIESFNVYQFPEEENITTAFEFDNITYNFIGVANGYQITRDIKEKLFDAHYPVNNSQTIKSKLKKIKGINKKLIDLYVDTLEKWGLNSYRKINDIKNNFQMFSNESEMVFTANGDLGIKITNNIIEKSRDGIYLTPFVLFINFIEWKIFDSLIPRFIILNKDPFIKNIYSSFKKGEITKETMILTTWFYLYLGNSLSYTTYFKEVNDIYLFLEENLSSIDFDIILNHIENTGGSGIALNAANYIDSLLLVKDHETMQKLKNTNVAINIPNINLKNVDNNIKKFISLYSRDNSGRENIQSKNHLLEVTANYNKITVEQLNQYLK